MEFNFSDYDFAPIIDLPEEYEVYNFSQGYDPDRKLKYSFGIGKYNEKRPTMYTHEQYEKIRNIHIGIDIGAPIGTAVKSFYSGQIFAMANNSLPGDYGYTLITEHQLGNKKLYALYGHLSEKSLSGKSIGQKILSGETIAWVGDKAENGGWNPHLHFQLSWLKPEGADLPGVVAENDLEQALKDYPDPQLVLGVLYED